MKMESDVEETQSLISDSPSRSYIRRQEKSIMENLDFDEVLKETGGFGKYQKTFYVLLCLPAMFTATITLSNTFTTAEPKNRCDIPSCDDKLMPQYEDAFVGPHFFANYTIPYDPISNEFKKCKYYQPIDNHAKDQMHHGRSDQISLIDNNSTTSISPYSTNSSLYQCDASHFNQSFETFCTNHVYDETIYTSTIVSEWNLVCNESWKVPLVESVFFAGVMVGAPLFGVLADTFGRKPTLMLSILITTLFGTPLGMSPNYYVFMVLNFFVAVGQLGIFQTCFIMVVELVSKEKRVLCGIVIEYFFDAGAVYLAGMAYVLRDWKHILLISTCPVSVFLMYWPIVPESVRWLLVNKKYRKAKKEIIRISKWNGSSFDINRYERERVNDIPSTSNGLSYQNTYSSSLNAQNSDNREERSDIIGIESPQLNVRPESRDGNRSYSSSRNGNLARGQTKETFLTFLQNPVMLSRHVNVCYCWLVVTLVYYGLSMNAGSLVPGDPYLNFLLSSLVEVPGYTLGYFGMMKLGRRITVCLTLVISGIALIIDAILSNFASANNPSLQYANIATFLIGKLAITATFGAIYIYTSELIPTSVRSAALGTNSMCGRVGAIISPYIASLQTYGMWIPLMIFGLNSMISGLLILLLPDTLGRELPETINDALKLGKVIVNPDDDREVMTHITVETEPSPQSNDSSEERGDEENGSLSEFEDDDQAVINCDDKGPLISNSDILSRSSFK